MLSDPHEALADHVARLKARNVSHISGTPSHWRKLLMSGSAAQFAPAYVRLSGEIADQAVLDGLKAAFPHASVGHAYASTEAGVGFAVNDGLEGFPADYLGNRNGVEMKVVDGSLRIRSARTAHAYIGRNAASLTDDDGFVDSGDIVELRGFDRGFREFVAYGGDPEDADDGRCGIGIRAPADAKKLRRARRQQLPASARPKSYGPRSETLRSSRPAP